MSRERKFDDDGRPAYVPYYKEVQEALLELDGDDVKEFVKAVYEHVYRGEEPECSGVARALFRMCVYKVDETIANSRSRSDAGREGGRRSKTETAGSKREADGKQTASTSETWPEANGKQTVITPETDCKQTVNERNKLQASNYKLQTTNLSTGGTPQTPSLPLGNFSDGSSSPASSPGITNQEKPTKRRRRRTRNFEPPSSSEVSDYARDYQSERGFSAPFDADKFIDYFGAQGWRLSNGNPMKDWKAAVRNWIRRDSPKSLEDIGFDHEFAESLRRTDANAIVISSASEL